MLSDRVCEVCHGDGRPAIERAVPVELVRRAKEIVQMLDTLDGEMQAAMAARMRTPVDDYVARVQAERAIRLAALAGEVAA